MFNLFHKELFLEEPNEYGWREIGERELSSSEKIDQYTLSYPILSLIHLSDLHICDAQSPARVEALDRFADPHHPFSEQIEYIGTYRAQEIMTTQTCEAMIRSINQIIEDRKNTDPIHAVVVTGDATDNAQNNELSWYHTLLDGGEISPNSGDSENWEGVSTTDATRYSPWYWNPEGTPDGCEDDYPRSLYGFPEMKGLTSAVQKSFHADGLNVQWFATHGNHDALLQGTVPPDDVTRKWVIGIQRMREFPISPKLIDFLSRFSEVGPAQYPNPEIMITEVVTNDTGRSFNEGGEWIEHHLSCGKDHGLSQENLLHNEKYWTKQIGDICLVSLDTVNENGGWQGSLDEVQFDWLRKILKRTEPKYFVILSHHPAATLFNLYSPNPSEKRYGSQEVIDLLLAEERVILWLAGHNHRHHIEKIESGVYRGFYHIETSSLIDWPQQGRVIDIYESEKEITIITKVFDHVSQNDLNKIRKNVETIENLSGLSRLLAGNDWQKRKITTDVSIAAGVLSDRNSVLKLIK